MDGDAGRGKTTGPLVDESTKIWNGVRMLTPFSVYEKCLDIIYPPTCIGCEADGEWVCSQCCNYIDHVETEDEILALGAYANPLLRSILTHIKYRSASCLKEPLQKLLRRVRQGRNRPWPWAGEPTLILCAIPSDARRVRERGIDHAKILLKIVQEELVPWAIEKELLKRTRHVVQNASLPANEWRRANVQGAFYSPETIEGAVLLIDDIYTTGATWHEAANTLKEAGATRVHGFVFARKQAA